MYKVKDNAEAQLQFGISSVATTLVVKEGQGVKFPEVPFLVVLNKRNSDWEITKSEKVEVSAVNGDQFTISRGFEWTTPSDFSADDFVSLFVLAKHIEQLQDKVEKKAEQSEMDSVGQRTTTLEEKVQAQEQKVEKLEEGNWADHLELRSFFWDREKNVAPAEEVVFVRQKLPAYEFSNLELNLGKEATNKEIHIQRLSSGIPSDEISFKLKKVQLPITNIEVEVRKGVVVDVDAENCYWYGGELLASGVVMNNKLGEEYWRIGIKLNKKISLPKGGLYSVVLRQAGGVVNAVNYYQIGCDTTQRSTAFGAVKVNGGARTPTRWMAFCDSEAFLEESVVLYRPQNDQEVYSIARMGDYNSGEGETIEFICPIDNPLISFRNATSGSYWMVTGFYFIQNGKRFPINRNRPPQKVLLKRWSVKLCLEGYRSHIVEIKLMFNANSDGLKVIGKHGTRYTLGESYWFGLAGFFNDKRIGPQIDTTNPTTSATTGTIAPGNYVSYLTVIGPDGKKYKIWAYAE